jgi:hypothetical protein
MVNRAGLRLGVVSAAIGLVSMLLLALLPEPEKGIGLIVAGAGFAGLCGALLADTRSWRTELITQYEAWWRRKGVEGPSTTSWYLAVAWVGLLMGLIFIVAGVSALAD